MTDARSVQIRDCHRQWLTECLRSSVLQTKLARSHRAMKGSKQDIFLRCRSLKRANALSGATADAAGIAAADAEAA